MSNESDNPLYEEITRLNGLVEAILIAFGSHLSRTTNDKQKKALLDLLEEYKRIRAANVSSAQMKGIEQAAGGLSVFLEIDKTEDAA